MDVRFKLTTNDLSTTPLVKALVRWATGKRLTNRLPNLSLITPVRLDIYSISLFLEGGVEDTPGFGIGSVRTIPRERPSTRVLMLVSLVLAPVFSFNSIFFVSPPRHADGTREGFDGGLSCHSSFFGGLSCHRAFLISPPRHTGGTR